MSCGTNSSGPQICESGPSGGQGPHCSQRKHPKLHAELKRGASLSMPPMKNPTGLLVEELGQLPDFLQEPSYPSLLRSVLSLRQRQAIASADGGEDTADGGGRRVHAGHMQDPSVIERHKAHRRAGPRARDSPAHMPKKKCAAGEEETPLRSWPREAEKLARYDDLARSIEQELIAIISAKSRETEYLAEQLARSETARSDLEGLAQQQGQALRQESDKKGAMIGVLEETLFLCESLLEEAVHGLEEAVQDLQSAKNVKQQYAREVGQLKAHNAQLKLRGVVNDKLELEIEMLMEQMHIASETSRKAISSKEALLTAEKKQHDETKEHMRALEARVKEAEAALAETQQRLKKAQTELKCIRPYIGRGTSSRRRGEIPADSAAGERSPASAQKPSNEAADALRENSELRARLTFVERCMEEEKQQREKLKLALAQAQRDREPLSWSPDDVSRFLGGLADSPGVGGVAAQLSTATPTSLESFTQGIRAPTPPLSDPTKLLDKEGNLLSRAQERERDLSFSNSPTDKVAMPTESDESAETWQMHDLLLNNTQLTPENDALVRFLSNTEECLPEVVATQDDDQELDVSAAPRGRDVSAQCRLRTSAYDTSVSLFVENRPQEDDISATSPGGAVSRSEAEADSASAGARGRSGTRASSHAASPVQSVARAGSHAAHVAASAARARCGVLPVLPEISEWEVHREGGALADGGALPGSGALPLSSNPFA